MGGIAIAERSELVVCVVGNDGLVPVHDRPAMALPTPPSLLAVPYTNCMFDPARVRWHTWFRGRGQGVQCAFGRSSIFFMHGGRTRATVGHGASPCRFWRATCRCGHIGMSMAFWLACCLTFTPLVRSRNVLLRGPWRPSCFLRVEKSLARHPLRRRTARHRTVIQRPRSTS
jgi:hypothetical protein